jgi:hypothetical protein
MVASVKLDASGRLVLRIFCTSCVLSLCLAVREVKEALNYWGLNSDDYEIIESKNTDL